MASDIAAQATPPRAQASGYLRCVGVEPLGGPSLKRPICKTLKTNKFPHISPFVLNSVAWDQFFSLEIA